MPDVFKIGRECLSCTERIKFVLLSDIVIPAPWDPARTERIRRRGSTEEIIETLLAIEITEQAGRDVSVNDLMLPQLDRRGGERYRISDGIHRINMAKELGLPGILAHTSDCKLVPGSECEEEE